MNNNIFDNNDNNVEENSKDYLKDKENSEENENFNNDKNLQKFNDLLEENNQLKLKLKEEEKKKIALEEKSNFLLRQQALLQDQNLQNKNQFKKDLEFNINKNKQEFLETIFLIREEILRAIDTMSKHMTENEMKGLLMIDKSIKKELNFKHNVEEIVTNVNDLFDEKIHAVESTEYIDGVENAEKRIVKVVSRGYMTKDLHKIIKMVNVVIA